MTGDEDAERRSGGLLGPADIASLLASFDLSPRKSLGQNFLADPNTARRIVRLAGIGREDRVLEVGPGVGSLTLALAEVGARVIALETDRHLLPALARALGDRPDVEVVHADAMQVDYPALLGDSTWTMVSNLPYHLAATLVVQLLEDAPQITRMLVMVQREVGLRLATPPGSAGCGQVSVRVSCHGVARVVGSVPASVFMPRPNVASVLVEVERHPGGRLSRCSEQLFELVRAGFGGRRKMLRRSLRPILGESTEGLLVAAGVDPCSRAEQLELSTWLDLADMVLGVPRPPG
ncbi:MAG: 16S rRNA (adenine(1518)-N(6)/adenine(1519)-N(6))-dimethyltransferase RsmA [Acidimicrobiia bacterium]